MSLILFVFSSFLGYTGYPPSYEDEEAFVFDRASKGKNIYLNRYNDTSKRFRGTLHLLSQWKGNVFKLIWHDLLIFVLLYFLISILYRCLLIHHDTYREWFELLCVFCGR